MAPTRSCVPSGPAPPDAGEALRLRELLQQVARDRGTITYAEAARELRLPPPVIARIATLLEALMAEDAAAGHPFLAAVVVGRARAGLPAPGFFAAAARLGRFAGDPFGEEAVTWHRAELAETYGFHALDSPAPRRL